MDIFSIPEAVPMGPISLSQLLSNANQRVSELTNRLQEEQERLGRITTLFENERNARLTAQNILEITCNELKESKNFLKLANDKISLLERRILIETGTFSRVLLKTTEISRCFGEPSACQPSDRVGRQKSREIIFPFSGGETGERAMLTDAPGKQTGRGATRSDKPPESDPEETTQGTLTGKRPMEDENSLASVRLKKKGPDVKSTSGLRHAIQRTLQYQREFTKLLRDKGDAIVGEFKASLRLFNKLHASLEKLRQPGEKEISGKFQEHKWQSEQGSTKQRLFNLGTKIEKMIIELASLTLDQKLHMGRIEADMRGFEAGAIFSDGSDNTEEKLMVFSQSSYRCKLARLIWDGAAHFRNETRQAP